MADDHVTHEPAPPVLRVITPDATDEEIAALVAVLSAMGGPGATPTRRQPSLWNAPYRQVRVWYSSGPGGWRGSGMPKHRGR